MTDGAGSPAEMITLPEGGGAVPCPSRHRVDVRCAHSMTLTAGPL